MLTLKKEQEQQISNLVNREIHTRELLLSLKSSMLPKEWSGQDEGLRILSIFCSILWLTEAVEAAFPLGALMVKTPSVLIVEVTRSAWTPLGKVNFCSKTRVRVPPASLTSCLATMTMVLPSTLTSNSSGLKCLQSKLTRNLSSSYVTLGWGKPKKIFKNWKTRNIG